MKKQILLSSLTGLMASFAIADVNLTINIKDSATPESTTRVAQSHLVTPAFQNPIHNEDLATTNTTPLYTIKSSGRYYLAGDITANRPTTTTGVVFSINASNVTFNLNSKVIAPHVSSAHTGATAIQVTAGVSNTTIMNGTIQAADSSGTARFAKGIEVLDTATVNNTVKINNIYVTKLRDVSGASNGFELNGINDLSVENCTANDATISSAAGAKTMYGAYLDTVNNFIIRNCEFNNNAATSSNTASTVVGLYCTTSNEGIVDNVIASNNAVTATGAVGACQGVKLVSSRDITLTNTQACSNVTTGGAAGLNAGIWLASAPLCTLVDCTANNNSDATTAANPTGFYIAASSDSCKFIRCRAEQNNTAVSTSVARGFYVASNCNRFENCRANANSGSGESYGMYFTSSSENQIVNCMSNYNQSSAAGVKGIYLTACNNNQFTGCEASGNVSATGSMTTAGFFSTGTGTGNIFDTCIASGNDAGASTTSAIVAGFYLDATEARGEILNCKAIGNRSGSTTCFAYGIYINSGTNCVVKNCYMGYNTVTGGAAFGFADDSSTGSTLLVNNIAAGQDKCLGDTLDASLQWTANTKPTTSNQNYFFKHLGTGDDPRNAIQEAPILNFLSVSTTVGDWSNISLY